MEHEYGMKKILLLLTVVVMAFPTKAQKIYTLNSPDGRLQTEVVPLDGGLSCHLGLDDGLLIRSFLALDYTQGDKEFQSLSVRKATRRSVDETIASPFTRQATMRDRYNELTLTMKEGVSVVFRAYNEGFAYRFVWEGKPGKVRKETVEYYFQDDWTTTAPYVISFDSTRHEIQYSTSFENHYTTTPLSQLDPRRLCFLPLLVHGPGGVKMCITESSLSDYPGLYLHGTGKPGELAGEHAPLPKRVEQGGHNNLQLIVKEREDYVAEMNKEKLFPWRILMVGSAEEIAMNNMSYLLGEPSKVQDISWIKPGKVAWDWWNNWNIGDVNFKAGINNDTYMHYIDFASRFGIEYVVRGDIGPELQDVGVVLLQQGGRLGDRRNHLQEFRKPRFLLSLEFLDTHGRQLELVPEFGNEFLVAVADTQRFGQFTADSAASGAQLTADGDDNFFFHITNMAHSVHFSKIMLSLSYA